MTRREWLSTTDPGPARRPGWRFLDGALVVPATESGRFAVEVATTYAAVESARAAELQSIELSGVASQVRATPRAAVLAVRSDGSSTTRFDVDWTPGAHRFVSRLDVSRLDAGPGAEQRTGVAWDLFLDPGDGSSRVPLSAAQALDGRVPPTAGSSQELSLRVARTSRLRIERGHPRPAVDRAEVADGSLRLTGRYARPDTSTPDIVLCGDASGSHPATTVASAWQGDRFTVGVAVAVEPDSASEWALGDGRWGVFLRDEASGDDLLPLEAGRELSTRCRSSRVGATSS